MGSPVDLTLSCSTQAAPSSSNGPCRNDSLYPGDYLESLRKAEEYLRSLEDERGKVEGFKRELPLCIHLLETAIQTSKEKLASGKKELRQLTFSSMESEKEYVNNSAKSVDSRPTLEEFIPLNSNMPFKRRCGAGCSDGETEGTSDQQQQPRGSKRPAWMAEAQLWTQNSISSAQDRHEKEKETEQFEQEQSSTVKSSQQLRLSSKERPAGAFLPFLRSEHPGTTAASPITVSRPVPRTGGGTGLSLSFRPEPQASPSSALKTPDWATDRATDRAAGRVADWAADSAEVGSVDATELQTPDANNCNHNKQMQATETGMATVCGNGVSGAGSCSGGGQSQRKARRCWSPELHRRFVSALHRLGGCQIATPKQIRELMKVDGLTNDEVKSHLQKYRLHTRRPSPSPQSPGEPQPPQLVVLGSIWMPPKYTSAASGSQPSSGVYDPQQQFCHSALPQDGYFACISNHAAPGEHMHGRQPIFEPQQAASQSQCSPQGPLQLTSQLSGATQGPSSSEAYHDDDDESGEEEEAKSDNTSWKTRSRSAERDSKIRSSTHNFEEELNQSNLGLNLQVACSAQSGVNTASEEEESSSMKLGMNLQSDLSYMTTSLI